MISHIDLSASRDSLIPVILGTSSASLAANTHSEAEHSSLASIGCRPRAGHCRLCTTSLDQVQALTQLQTVCSVCQVYRLTCGAPLDGALECPAFFFFFDAPRRKDLARSDHESPGMSRTAVGGSTSRLTRARRQFRSAQCWQRHNVVLAGPLSTLRADAWKRLSRCTGRMQIASV